MADSQPDKERVAALVVRAIEEAERRGYERGVKETMARIQQVVLGGAEGAKYGPGDVKPTDAVEPMIAESASPTQRRRAPKGLVRKVVQRALRERPGLTPKEIEETARDDLERMISSSSYRSELRKGRDSGLFREDGGRWYLAETDKAEERPESLPSAFRATTERR
jgi:hypothetical protein